MKKGFTLIEMLVVIGIIMILLGASISGYSRMVRTAEDARARELVSNVATALQALYVREGQWPKALISAATGDNLLSERAAYALAKKGYMSLEMNDSKTKLGGADRLGVVTPWAQTILKEKGRGVNESTIVTTSKEGKSTVQDHTLRFAIDLEGNGFTELPGTIDGLAGKKVRATACVWCCNKDGSLRERNLITSWASGQIVEGR